MIGEVVSTSHQRTDKKSHPVASREAGFGAQIPAYTGVGNSLGEMLKIGSSTLVGGASQQKIIGKHQPPFGAGRDAQSFAETQRDIGAGLGE